MKIPCNIPSDLDIHISSNRGKLISLSNSNGSESVVIEPINHETGEFSITAQARWEDQLIIKEKTVLVFSEIADKWGQPQKVEELVNTMGWEDGPYINPDGRYLFISYYPISASCLFEPYAHKESCSIIAEGHNELSRPLFNEMIANGRINGNQLKNTCEKFDSDLTEEFMNANNLIFPPASYYGFKRQDNGSFTEPFVIGIKGIGGCSTPWGMEIHADVNEDTFLWQLGEIQETMKMKILKAFTLRQ